MLMRKFQDQRGVELSFARQLPTFSLALSLASPAGVGVTFVASPADLRAIAGMLIEAADGADRMSKLQQ
jgi:hypothetical protein